MHRVFMRGITAHRDRDTRFSEAHRLRAAMMEARAEPIKRPTRDRGKGGKRQGRLSYVSSSVSEDISGHAREDAFDNSEHVSVLRPETMHVRSHHVLSYPSGLIGDFPRGSSRRECHVPRPENADDVHFRWKDAAGVSAT